MEQWWKNEPWRMIQTNLRQIDMVDIDAKEYVEQLKKFNATVVMINTGGILASYPTCVEDHTVSDFLTGDSLKQVMEECHKEGIRVIARMDFSKVRRAAYEKHPDWAYRTAKGEIVDYNGDVQCCLCGDFQQVKSFEIMREVAETLPIDGVFINMGGFQTRDYSYRYHGICHCDNCKRRFKGQFGLELPEKEDPSDPVLRKYRAFQTRTMTDYRERLEEMLHGINPEIAIDGVDFFRIESNTEYRERQGEPYWQYASSSIIRGIQSLEPGIPCSNSTVDFIGFYYRHVAVSPYMQALRLWQNIANFGMLDYYLIGRLDNHRDRSGFSPVKKAFAYHAAHWDKYRNMSLCADTLLIHSSYGASKEGLGWVRALTESHIPLKEAGPGALREGQELSQFKTIIAADIRSLSDEQAKILDRYVENGGSLIVTGQTGLQDSEGELRREMPLACLGVGQLHGLRSDMVSAMLSVGETDKGMFTSFEDVDVIYTGDDFMFVSCEDTVEKHLCLIPPHPYGPPERCYYTQITEIPGMTINRYGKGKAIHIPWSPGLLYYRDGFENSLRFMRDVLTRAAGVESVEDKPFTPMVEVTVGRESGGSHAMVQLVNATGHFGRSFFEPVPVGDICLKIPLKRQPVRLERLTTGGKVPYVWEDGLLRFRIDGLQEFECVFVQL
jgi:hypothetical protein